MSEKKTLTGITEYAQLERLLKKWDALSGNLTTTELSAPIILPDLFITADGGCEISEVLKTLTSFLSERGNLMDFLGDVKFFQFLLGYCPPDDDFEEIRRLMREVKHAAGFRSVYKGIVHIDVGEWLGHSDEKHFIELLNYLAENSKDWMIVLSVRYSKKRETDIEAMRKILSMFLRAEMLRLTLPKPEHYLDVLRERLNDYGIRLSPDAEELMKGTLKVLCGNKYFGGTFTVGMLAQDIVYTIYSRSGAKTDVLTAAALKEFEPDSEYVQRTAVKLEMSNKIGFNN